MPRPAQPEPPAEDPFRSVGGHLTDAARALAAAHAELRALRPAKGAPEAAEHRVLVRDLELLADVALDLRLQVESALLLGTAALGGEATGAPAR